jgi:large subunit ribosomal protein L15
VVNVGDLAAFPGTTVNLKTLIEAGYVRGSVRKVKILGEGELKKALTVEGVEVSASAKAKIEAAKGTVANKNNG